MQIHTLYTLPSQWYSYHDDKSNVGMFCMMVKERQRPSPRAGLTDPKLFHCRHNMQEAVLALSEGWQLEGHEESSAQWEGSPKGHDANESGREIACRESWFGEYSLSYPGYESSSDYTSGRAFQAPLSHSGATGTFLECPKSSGSRPV